MTNSPADHRRILIVDDNRAIHEDFRKIFGREAQPDESMARTEAALFGDGAGATTGIGLPTFNLDSAFQGAQALAMVEASLREDRPYAMAFVDVRMPPGWDGVETIYRVWQQYPELEVVLCTAYSDYPWESIVDRLKLSHRLVILKKPFDNIEVLQLACCLTEKWRLARETKARLSEFEHLVRETHRDLELARAELAEARLRLTLAEMGGR